MNKNTPSSSEVPDPEPTIYRMTDETIPTLELALSPGGMLVEVGQPELVVGRHSEADLRLPLPEVSRRHCCFRYVGGQWEVVDLTSMNGTFVNETLIERISLRHGDRVRIGGFTFEVRLDHNEAVPQPNGDLIRVIFKDRLETAAYLGTVSRKAS